MQSQNRLKSYFAKFCNTLLRIYFRRSIGNKEFCIISNDCWGAECYKVLNRPFNTPFIGLMLMSPCYIQLLEDLRYYLSLPLVFKKKSKYQAMEKINAGVNFPVAVLGDSEIEIQFLHYESEEMANEKWLRRVKRIDWNNIFVKYDCGKDYAEKESAEKFISMAYPNKLIFGKEDFGIKEVYVLEKYSLDAVVQFRNCFLSFNPIRWLACKREAKDAFQRLICKNASKYL